MQLAISPFTGEFAALSAAFCWAAATAIYGRVGVKIPPLQLNLMKGAIASVLLGLTLIGLGLGIDRLNPRSTALLLLGGAIGIGLGDTAYFLALNALGPRKALLLETLSSPLSAAIALLFLGERLEVLSGCGIALTLFGVAWTICERSRRDTVISPQRFQTGLLWGLLAQLSQAIAGVLSRAALAGTEISPIWSSLLRIGAGIAVIGLLLALRSPKQPLPSLKKLKKSPRLLSLVVLAAFSGTYLAMILQQTAFKYSPAGIAQTLLTTSPLFILPISALSGERISLRALLGTSLAVAGIFILFR
ncbi:DMT family transporter [Oscillatoria sp. FACHB-1406]|uniref:DMT family transporter n=1 Tax=Oscillatoria sp. FACHB-1406 TaxID=2692846 RepID=UPI0016870945|nr:DMT family transporter [Oscillatoria sp. FACHB-1406]MBD2580463.1 DMT family transporter [Oscillatoria sp. FACHB-1406]